MAVTPVHLEKSSRQSCASRALAATRQKALTTLRAKNHQLYVNLYQIIRLLFKKRFYTTDYAHLFDGRLPDTELIYMKGFTNIDGRDLRQIRAHPTLFSVSLCGVSSIDKRACTRSLLEHRERSKHFGGYVACRYHVRRLGCIFYVNSVDARWLRNRASCVLPRNF